MRGKFLYLDEWVRVRNFMNRHFHAADSCSICRRLACDMVWYSIKTHEVRCQRCFDAETLHYRRNAERSAERSAARRRLRQ